MSKQFKIVSDADVNINDDKKEILSKEYAERVCSGEFPITYSREQVVKHTANDFIEGWNKCIEIMRVKSKPKAFSEQVLLGVLLLKIEFWSDKYDFSFQFWGEDNNNVFINKDDVEIQSFGGEGTIKEILEITLLWIEKVNPKVKYPLWLEEIYNRY